MFRSAKVRIDRALWEKVKAYATAAGYASAEELVTHAVETELAHIEEGDNDAEIRKKLRGLGYIS